MPESILQKKSRILGSAMEGSQQVMQAVRNREWTARDATEFRKAISDGKRLSHADRVAMTIKRVIRTPQK